MRAFKIWKRRTKCMSMLLFVPLILTILIIWKSHVLSDNQIHSRMQPRKKVKIQEEYIDKRGIHVIVGHYIGNDLPWQSKPNLTHEILNKNYYSPNPKAGAMGEAYFVMPAEREKSRALFYINKFNLLASDRIPVNRSLPDERRMACRKKQYSLEKFSTTSVIIVYHNEAWSTLIRTVHSVINRSPRLLLKEIILVDDASTREFLKDSLDKFVSQLSVPVKIIRSANRTGLIRARLLGVAASSGDVLTFLDAHCECSKGWLEPLLALIAEKRTQVACPVIDIIHDETFAYVKSFELHWGAFNWDLHFRWYPVSVNALKSRQNDTTAPFRTPVMAGGLFSIDKSYFKEIGLYDKEMDIWGGENIELSFRVWQCGGSIKIVPCSHVGHVFRKSSPYSFPRPGGVGAVLYQNLARAAATWMDGWKQFYFKMNPQASKIYKTLNIDSRLELRKELNCKSFEWYLENIWPEHFLPTKNRFFGKIRNMKKGECIQKGSVSAAQQNIGKVKLFSCVIEIYPKQLFIYSEKGQIMTDDSVCFDSPEGAEDTYVVLLACNEIPRQKWIYDSTKKMLIHSQSKLCLSSPSMSRPEALTLQVCDGSTSQEWSFEAVDWAN